MNRVILICGLSAALWMPAAGGQAPAPFARFDLRPLPVLVDSAHLVQAVRDAQDGNCRPIRVLALTDATFAVSSLASTGARLVVRVGDVAAVEVCESVAPFLRLIPGIRYVKMPAILHTSMDSVRSQCRVDPVQQGTAQSGLPRADRGKGVLVGMLDTGFDVFHPAFLDSAGKTRFIAVWNQQDTAVKNQNKFGYGVIKTAAQMELDSLFCIDSAEFHGTHTSSLAAGGQFKYNYQGVAPDAMIAGVKYLNTDNDLVTGLTWLFGLADSIGKASSAFVPCVANLSIGIAWGPHDGTSLFDRVVDSLSGPGRIVVGAAGNDGDKHSHVLYTLTSGQTSGTWLEPYVVNGSGEVSANCETDIWGEKGKTFRVQCRVLDTLSRTSAQLSQVITTTPDSVYPTLGLLWNSGGGRIDTCIFQVTVEAASPLNGKPHASVLYRATSTQLWLGVSVSVVGTANAQSMHAWNANKLPCKSFAQTGYLDGDSLYSIDEIGSTADSIISVGAYVSKRDIILWNGTPLATGAGNGAMGDLAVFSGLGPTVDGRNKPDITAPGSTVAGAMARTTADYNRTVVWPDTTNTVGRYTAFTGTSMSAPIVTGIVALMLEAKPNLGPTGARQALQATAITDAFTGTTPNVRWGAGKANALGAVARLLNITQGVAFEKGSRTAVAPAVSFSGRSVRVRGAGTRPIIEVYDMRGKKITRIGPLAEGTVVLPPIASGVYTIVVRDARGFFLCQRKILAGS